MDRRPSNNPDEALGSSSKNMKATTAYEMPTFGKQYKDFEYSIYDQTKFQTNRSEFLYVCQKIRNQRLIQHLGRYRPKEEKQSQLNIFRNNFFRLKELLFLMSKEADKYKSLIATSGSSKQVRSTNVSCDYEISFRKKIRKDLKEIQTWWIELFCEGSLKRLIPILSLLRIQEDEIDFGLDITQWHLQTEFKFSSHYSSKSCCCG